MARSAPSVNTSNKRVAASMAAGGGPSPLAVSGGWAQKRVPRAWKRQLPGTPYPCDDPAIGSRVTLRGDDAPSTVTGCATPTGPGLLQRGRVSDRYEHQGALMVKLPVGVEVPVPRSVVRERQRREREAGRETCTCTGLPYPHRAASTPLCELHPENAGELTERARDAYETGDDDAAEEFRRRVEAIERRQGAAYQAAEARRAQGGREYRARVSRARKDARSEGWAV